MRVHAPRPSLITGALAVLLAACAGGPTDGLPSIATASPAATASPDGGTAAPVQDARPLQALLPSEFGGAQAHRFAVGQEMVSAVADALGLGPGELEVAYASDHGAAFVQMYALRAGGLTGEEILAALATAAYPDVDPASVSATEQLLGTRRVTVITEPTAAATIGSFYCVVDGSVLIVAQALTEPVAEAAYAALPSPSQPPRDY